MGTVNITADSALVQRGSFSEPQVKQLLGSIKRTRVVRGSHVKPHLSQQDVRAHLIRVFGFGHTDVEVVESGLVFEQERTAAAGNNAAKWDVCYMAKVRLTVRNPGLVTVATYEDVSTATAENQARGAAHDLALKSAVSLAMKRATTYLGDQFGLSLYNKGQEEALVGITLVGVKGANETGDVQANVQQQLEDGLGDAMDDDGDQSEPAAPSAMPAPRKRATNGTQGTKRAPAAAKAPEAAQPAAEPAAAEEAKPEPVAVKPVDQQAKLDEIAAARVAKSKQAAEAKSRADADQAEADEREQRAIIAAEQDALQAKRESDDAAEHANPRTGEVSETANEVAARIKADRAARGAATVAALPEPWAEGQVRDWRAELSAAATVEAVKAVWDGATAAKEMTTELRMDVIKRKARVESEILAATNGPAEDEQPPIFDEN